MAIGEAIRTRLAAVAGVTSLTAASPFGSSGEAIYVGDTQQGASSPRVEIHELGLDPMLCLDGTYGLRSATVDIDCKATSLVGAHNLADAVEAGFNDYTGTVGSTVIAAVMLQDRSDSVETPDTGSEKRLYVTTLDYQVQFS